MPQLAQIGPKSVPRAQGPAREGPVSRGAEVGGGQHQLHHHVPWQRHLASCTGTRMLGCSDAQEANPFVWSWIVRLKRRNGNCRVANRAWRPVRLLHQEKTTRVQPTGSRSNQAAKGCLPGCPSQERPRDNPRNLRPPPVTMISGALPSGPTSPDRKGRAGLPVHLGC